VAVAGRGCCVGRWGRPLRRAPTNCRSSPVRATGSVFDQEAAELVRARRVPELAQRLGLYLADALARDVELLADFLERVVGVHVDAEAHPEHLGLPRRQA